MQPIKFPQSNVTLKERLSGLFFGLIWVSVISGRIQPPIALWGTRYIFEESKEKPADSVICDGGNPGA